MWPVLATRIERRPCTRSTEATHFPLNHKRRHQHGGYSSDRRKEIRNSLLWINRFLWKVHWCPMFTELEAWGTDVQWTACLQLFWICMPPKTQGRESNATPWRTTSHTRSVVDIELPIFQMIWSGSHQISRIDLIFVQWLGCVFENILKKKERNKEESILPLPPGFWIKEHSK